MKAEKKYLSVFSLVMINVIAIDSLRTLPVSAEYGFSLVFFYLIGAICFFLPVALVSAELSTAWPNTGGSYVWIRQAFGTKWGFLAIWLMWVYNIVWYPAIYSFVGATLAYLIDPALVNNPLYLLKVTLSAFWVITVLNCLGIKGSSIFSAIGAILGTILPMLFICVLGGIWIFRGKPLSITFDWHSFLPSSFSLDYVVFFVVILFGLVGLDMSAIHAGDVKTPERDFPRALVYSSIIILFTLVLSSLAIALVIPVKQLSVVTGLIDAFSIFLHAYNLDIMIPIVVAAIVVGSLACAGTWMLGPSRALAVAFADTHLPTWLSRSNRQRAPAGILIIQALVSTVLCSVFLLMPSVNSSYWILSALSAQLAMLFYILLFAAAIRLRYKHSDVKRSYRIPGGKVGIWGVCLLGAGTCLTATAIGFVPPAGMQIGSLLSYETIMMGGLLLLCLPAFLIRFKK